MNVNYFSGLFYFYRNTSFPVNIGIKTSHYITGLVEGGFYENELRGKRNGVKWEAGNKLITLFEDDAQIIAYPSPLLGVAFRYVELKARLLPCKTL